MEATHHTLKPPKRQLCYLTNKDGPPKQWAGAQSLGDIDKMFDDIAEPSLQEEEDLLPSCPLLQSSDTNETNHGERGTPPAPQQEGHATKRPPQKGAKAEILYPATRSPSPELGIDVDIPFKAHRPVKTSSPVEVNMAVNEMNRAVSPLLFACEDEEKEEEKTEPPPSQNPQCNGDTAEQDYDFESPPSMVSIGRLKMLSHKRKVEETCKETHPVHENEPKKSRTAHLEGKREAPRKDHAEPLVSAVRQEPEAAAPKKNVEQPPVEASTHVGEKKTSFLQKLREAAQPKSSCSLKWLSPVKVQIPPEPEDDFLILDDDTPLWLSIPNKSATSKRRSKTSSPNKDSSTDKGRKEESPMKAAQKQQQQSNSKLGSQKKKKMKGREKKNEMAEPGNGEEELCRAEDVPADDLEEREKPNKKKPLKRESSKESDKAEEPPKDQEKPTKKLKNKAQMSSDTKKSKPLEVGSENGKTSRAESLKRARSVTQGCGAGKEAVQEETSEEQADAEDPPLTDKEIINSQGQMHRKNKQNKLPVVSETSSSEDSQIVAKRRRRPPGQWWLSSPQGTADTEVSVNKPTAKKSKQNNKERHAAAPSPAKRKKNDVLKGSNQTPPAPSSSRNKTKEKTTRRKKDKNTGRATPVEMKAVEAVDEIIEQQLEVQDPDPVLSSPLVLPGRDHSHDSEDQAFQRVYHHSPNEKRPVTAGPVSRTRKCPGDWWTVKAVTPQPKLQKERKKRSKQIRSTGLQKAKNGNVAVSLSPSGGAPVPPLTVKLSSPPKSVKSALSTFKDIFTSARETPTVSGSREAGLKSRRKATAGPAVEVTVTDSALSQSEDEMDAADSNSEASERSGSKGLRSGPSSMIELISYEENDDMNLPSTTTDVLLSASDLCAPPLKPLILQRKDKANLREWFKSLWPSTVGNGPQVTPEQFDWYFYQGRVIGFLVDQNSGSICYGTILLGSYMKKPLWVDHSATTVFHLLTSSLSVIINGSKSCFSAGQSFMVPCGHAYSIQNVGAQPAVLNFTRVFAENSD